MVNVIADVAGRFDELMLLLDKMPKGEEVISLGDMIDRGPKSKEVLEWFMKNGKAIFGNHEHLMLDFCRQGHYYENEAWLWNGGRKTLNSFDPTGMIPVWDVIPQEILTWVEFLPKYIEIENCLLSHSFVRPGFTLEQACDFGDSYRDFRCDNSIIWYRDVPKRIRKYKMQITGHNTHMERFVDSEGEFAICLDDSGKKKLTGIHLPSMEVFQQEYLK